MPGEHPIMLGPIFLHGNSDFDTFFLFFNHLYGALTVAGAKQQPIFGSDDEKSLRMALIKAFPNAMKVNCTRHLQKNVVSYLRDKMGIKSKQRKFIIEAIFGEQGMAHAKDSIEFTCKQRKVKKMLTAEMKQYFVKVFEKLEENFNASQAPHFTHLKPNWTNNNCESINHVLKQKVSWKFCDLAELVIKLKEVVQGQYNRTKKALLGLSRWKLDSYYQNFYLGSEKWLKKSPENRETLFKKFLSTPKKMHGHLVISTDGQRSSLAPKHKGKKPGQRRRLRMAKTTTISSKKE